MIDVLLFISGAGLAWLTLKDVFDTVVVPGGGRNSLQVTRRIGFALLTLWKRVRRHRGISGSFAPFVLVTSFAIWMCALALGFGMMAYGVRSHFDPPIESFWDAVYEPAAHSRPSVSARIIQPARHAGSSWPRAFAVSQS